MTEFAPHFPFVEFSRQSDMVWGDTELEYAAQLSQLLERFRAALGGGPIVLTSWLRSDSDTQHHEGTAIDARLPPGVTERQVYAASQQLQQAGVKWGQLIFYPYGDRHFHISLPTGVSRNRVMVQLYDTGGNAHDTTAYRDLTPELLAKFPTTPANGPLDTIIDVATAIPTTGTMGALLFALGVSLMLS